MLSKFIVYAINKLNELNIPAGKTFIQKLFYLSFDKKQREIFYIPYHYGPYSEDVQYVLNSFIRNGYLEYDRSQKTLISFVENDKFDSAEKAFRKRIDSIVNFIDSQGLLTTTEISYFSKIVMILENNSNYKGNKLELVKDRASLLGWDELAQLPSSRIDSYIKKHKDLVGLTN